MIHQSAPFAFGTPSARALVDDFASGLKFPLDDFQREAMGILAEGRSVLVAAPTGSGKTMVAEFAVHAALKTGTRCIYTTPLKALSNQKYRDLRDELGEGVVGLVTGDVVITPEAPILVMTTEILRNILQMDPAQVDDVSFVILDEAHYLGSDGRGTVWEETIVFLGKHTSIVALSATIPNADELAGWVSSVHKPMDVVVHTERPVPLMPFVALKSGIEPLFDKRSKLRVRAFAEDGWVTEPQSSQVVKDLAKKEMLPAIFFVFSRVGCEREAIAVLKSGLKLTSPAEAQAIQKAVDEALAQTPGMLASNATKWWLERLPQGVAPHHAGLLPPLKYLIEILFQRGLLKVVFATETLAAGINMPARTVVISSLSKRTDEGHRLLHVSEFAQMTGRAGRRGMDTVGYGVVLASHRYGVHDVAALFTGEAEPLRSRFTLNYNMVANLIHRYEPETAKRIVEQCFSQYQSTTEIRELEAARAAALLELGELDAHCPRHPDATSRRENLLRVKAVQKKREDARQAALRLEQAQGALGKQEGVRAIQAAPFHSFLVVHRPGHPKPELAILLDKFKVKSGEMQFTVLLENQLLTRLGVRHLVLPLGAKAQGVPKELAYRAEKLSFQQTVGVKDLGKLPWQLWLEQAGIEPEAVLPDAGRPNPALAKARAALEKLNAEWESVAEFNCRTCIKAEKDESKVTGVIRALDQQIDEIRHRYWRQFQALQATLEAGDFMRGRELLPRGHAIANLRTQNELLAAEAFASGILEGLDASDLCAVASCIVAEPVRGRMTWRPIRPSPRVVEAVDELIDMAIALDQIQKKCGTDQPLYVVSDYAGMVQAWADGAQWAHVTEMAGIDEGQLVRHMRLVIDMLQQFKDVPGAYEGFKAKVTAALELVDRDIVKEVF